jgi:hypothetical protein
VLRSPITHRSPDQRIPATVPGVAPTLLSARGPRWSGLFFGTALAASLIAGCSGTKHSSSTPRTTSLAGPSTSTTTAPPSPMLPPPANGSAVKAFLTGPGHTLFAFEQATVVLGSGKIPSDATCSELRLHTLPRVVPDPRRLQRLISQVPDLPLRIALQQDVQAKFVIVGGCATAGISPAQLAAAKASSTLISTRFAQIGIRL